MFFRDIFIRRHRQDDERFLNRFSQRLSDEVTLKELLKTMKGDVAEVLRVAHQNQGMCCLFLCFCTTEIQTSVIDCRNGT